MASASFHSGGPGSPSSPNSKKRRLSMDDIVEDEDMSNDDDDQDDSDMQGGRRGHSQDKEKNASRESHCEIERRRRNKMAAYISELCDMVPACSTLARKPDKLTILRMAVSHMKNLRGNVPNRPDAAYKPSFLTDQELKHLILEAADGFLFVVQCESGRLLYVSDAVEAVLNFPQAEWFGKSLFDYIHPDDVEKLREQLSSGDQQSSGRILDLKTGTVKKEGHQSNMRLCVGSRRGFIIRMRLGTMPIDSMTRGRVARIVQQKTFSRASDGQNYSVVHVTGYLKNWPPAESGHHGSHGAHMERNDEEGASSASTAHSCLVAIARLQMTSQPNCSDLNGTNNNEFISRHSIDGKFTFLDHRVTNVLGYQTQELLGKTAFDFYHPEDVADMKENFERVLKLKGQMMSVMYRFQCKNREWVWLRSNSFAFLNPYTEDIEYVVSTNTLAKQQMSAGGSDMMSSYVGATETDVGGASSDPMRRYQLATDSLGQSTDYAYGGVYGAGPSRQQGTWDQRAAFPNPQSIPMQQDYVPNMDMYGSSSSATSVAAAGQSETYTTYPASSANYQQQQGRWPSWQQQQGGAGVSGSGQASASRASASATGIQGQGQQEELSDVLQMLSNPRSDFGDLSNIFSM